MHFSHIGFTDGLTFIVIAPSLFSSPYDSAFSKVIGRHFNQYFVSRKNSDKVHTKLSGTLWQTNNIQVGGLLFSGLLISSLGAVMDVAMSISSSMQELCSQNPEISRLELMRAGMRVGRDMMGTDSNTLILAFAGTSLSMLVLDYAYELPYLQIINSNNIGIAVMQGLSGSFGVVLTVPATVLMAAYIYKGENG